MAQGEGNHKNDIKEVFSTAIDFNMPYHLDVLYLEKERFESSEKLNFLRGLYRIYGIKTLSFGKSMLVLDDLNSYIKLFQPQNLILANTTLTEVTDFQHHLNIVNYSHSMNKIILENVANGDGQVVK